MNKLALCLAGVAAASSAIAVPNMQSRQEAGVPAVDCAGEVYDEVEDFNSWVMGCQLIVFPPSEPADFPAEFDNAENFNFTTPAPWHRFPLIHGGVPWSEGEPGPDRAILHAGALDDGSPFCQVAGYITQRKDNITWSLCTFSTSYTQLMTY